jgi:fucose 4-O-acetylase-like acetyltransferase
VANKDNYLTTFKAMGIILMVVGHSGCPEYLHQLIYYFHMPLFFFVSGYFFHLNGDTKSFVVKRIKGLYLPYVKWGIAFLLLHNILFEIGIYNGQYGYNGNVFHAYDFHEYIVRFCFVVFTMDKHEPMLGGFWFLKTLFLASIMVRILVKLVSYLFENKKIVITFLLCLFGLLITKYFEINLPYVGNLSIIFLGAVFYLIGYGYRRIEKESFYQWYYVFVSGTVLLIFTSAYHPINMYCNFDDVFMYIIIACNGMYSTLGICYHLEKKGWGLYYIGKNTMQILALHFMSFKIVSLCVILLYALPTEMLSEFPVIKCHQEITWPLYSLVGISLPLLIKVGYNKMKPCLYKM